MPDAATRSYFVRIHGKVMGPFDVQQLRSLRDRGRLREDHEVSVDRKQWESAGKMETVFDSRPAMGFTDLVIDETEPNPAANQFPPGGPSKEWFYSKGGVQDGPVTFTRLQKMIRQGRISALDLIWREGFEDWQPASEIPEFSAILPAVVSGVGTTRFADEPSVLRGQTILWDTFLSVVSEQISPQGLNSAVRGLTRFGGHSMTAAMLIGAGYFLVRAIKIDSAQTLLWGFGVVLGISVFKYLGVHLNGAAGPLIASTPNQISTTALCGVIAVSMLSLAIGCCAASIYHGLASDDLSDRVFWFVTASQAVVVFGFMSHAALHPDWLAVSVKSGTSAGTEGIGMLSFCLKLLMRMTSISFAMSGALAAAGFAVAFGLLVISGKESLLPAQELAIMSSGQAFVAGLLPLVAYLLLIFWSILLDAMQALISLPARKE